MESVPSTSMGNESTIAEPYEASIPAIQGSTETTTLAQFKCSYCPIEGRVDFKGTKPPFARQITYSEECYVMKDPFSLPNRGEVLVLGADCSVCEKPVCLGCSIYFAKRFCLLCVRTNMQHIPAQIHPKIKALIKTVDS